MKLQATNPSAMSFAFDIVMGSSAINKVENREDSAYNHQTNDQRVPNKIIYSMKSVFAGNLLKKFIGAAGYLFRNLGCLIT